MKINYLLFLVLFLLFGCTNKGVITSIDLYYVSYGIVENKTKVDEWVEIKTELVKNGDSVYPVTKSIRHDAEYYIHVMQSDSFTGKDYYAEFKVSESSYHNYSIGDTYGSIDEDKKKYWIFIKNGNKTGFKLFNKNPIKKFKVGDYIDFNSIDE